MILNRDHLKLLSFCAAVLLAPVLASPVLFPKEAFDAAPVEALARERPDIVIIGDSMAITRVDPERLSALCGGARVAMLTDYGSASARWFLFLKNHLAASGARPKITFVFFRDYALGWPAFRTTGRYGREMESEMHEEEPEIEQVLGTDGGEGRWASRVERWFPLAERRGEAGDWVVETALDWLPKLFARSVDVREESKDLFDLDNLRDDVPAEMASEDGPVLEAFDSSPDVSFVPHMVDVAEANGLRLCFVRVKRRPRAAGEDRQDKPGLAAYVADLRGYVEGRGMHFHDFSRDPAIGLELFADGDHIGKEHRRRWTEIFRERLAEVLE